MLSLLLQSQEKVEEFIQKVRLQRLRFCRSPVLLSNNSNNGQIIGRGAKEAMPRIDFQERAEPPAGMTAKGKGVEVKAGTKLGLYNIALNIPLLCKICIISIHIMGVNG